MKKALVLLLALVLGPKLAWCVTDTPTDTPTNTPTYTITPTFTPTATFTNTPVAQLDANMSRDYIYPGAVYATDGVVLASAVTTPLPGVSAPWVAQNISSTTFVMSTGSAKVRFSYGIQGDFAKGVNAPNMNIWAYCSTTSTVAALTVTLNVARRSMNNLYPQGGVVYLGTATDVTSSFVNSSITGKVLRVKLPLSGDARFQVGDQLSFDLQRTGGVTSDLYIHRLEVEYLNNPYHQR